MINYPNGSKHRKNSSNTGLRKKSLSAANRGMALEKMINAANTYYLDNNVALFTKRPTPINVVKIDYDHGAKITDAYFEKQSTTDYNGVYKAKYFDFEAKSTQLKTSFPLNNIYKHQITHLENVLAHGGIAFFIVEFATLNEIYVIDAQTIIAAYKQCERKSIPYTVFKNNGILVPLGFNPLLDYLSAVAKLFNL